MESKAGPSSLSGWLILARTSLARHSILVATLVALAVLAARLIFVFIYGGDFPVGDQFLGELPTIYAPYVNGTLRLGNFFANASEHIQAIPHLLDFALLWLTGTWNHLNELKVHTAVPAATAGALAYCHLRVSGRPGILQLLMIAMLFALPVGYFNALSGTGSVFTFSILFSVCALWIASHPQFPRHGLASGILWTTAAFLSLGNGILTMLVLVIATSWNLLVSGDEGRRRLLLPGVLLCAAAVAMLAVKLWATISIDVLPASVAHIPISVANMARVLFDLMSWPGWPWPWIGMLIWLPFGLALYQVWTTRHSGGLAEARSSRFAVLLYGWVLANFLGIAHSRSFYAGMSVQPRYYDVALLALVAALFVPLGPWLRRVAPVALAACAVWMVAWIRMMVPQIEELSNLYQRMAVIEETALSLEAVLPGEGYRYFVANSSVVRAMYPAWNESTYMSDFWTQLNDPVVQRLRPGKVKREFQSWHPGR